MTPESNVFERQALQALSFHDTFWPNEESMAEHKRWVRIKRGQKGLRNIYDHFGPELYGFIACDGVSFRVGLGTDPESERFYLLSFKGEPLDGKLSLVTIGRSNIKDPAVLGLSEVKDFPLLMDNLTSFINIIKSCGVRE